MTAETRLAAVATKLTPMERARLVLRADFAGETLDPNLLRVLKPDEDACRRIVDAVHEANDRVLQACSYMVEWLYQEEIQLGWLRSLDAMLGRDATLREALRAAGWTVREDQVASVERKAKVVVLSALPQPGHGLARTLPSIWGAKAYPEEEEVEPADLEGLREHLAFALRRTVELRWRELLALRVVLGELSDIFGEAMVHHEPAGILDQIEATVLALYEGLCRRGERFPLPARDEERITGFRSWMRWEDLKEPAAFGQSSDAVRWLPPGMQEQLEALEARLAEELRGGS